MASSKWYSKGIKFQCQGSGKCCVSRGQYGYVYLTDDDRKAMAKELKVSLTKFTEEYCDKSDGLYHLKEEKERTDCMFLKDKKCEIYKARPTQCRTWPFWPENMNAKNWKRDVVQFCPGVGKGKVVPKSIIEKNLKEQTQADKDLGI